MRTATVCGIFMMLCLLNGIPVFQMRYYSNEILRPEIPRRISSYSTRQQASAAYQRPHCRTYKYLQEQVHPRAEIPIPNNYILQMGYRSKLSNPIMEPVVSYITEENDGTMRICYELMRFSNPNLIPLFATEEDFEKLDDWIHKRLDSIATFRLLDYGFFGDAHSLPFAPLSSFRSQRVPLLKKYNSLKYCGEVPSLAHQINLATPILMAKRRTSLDARTSLLEYFNSLDVKSLTKLIFQELTVDEIVDSLDSKLWEPFGFYADAALSPFFTQGLISSLMESTDKKNLLDAYFEHVVMGAGASRAYKRNIYPPDFNYAKVIDEGMYSREPCQQVLRHIRDSRGLMYIAQKLSDAKIELNLPNIAQIGTDTMLFLLIKHELLYHRDAASPEGKQNNIEARRFFENRQLPHDSLTLQNGFYTFLEFIVDDYIALTHDYNDTNVLDGAIITQISEYYNDYQCTKPLRECLEDLKTIPKNIEFRKAIAKAFATVPEANEIVNRPHTIGSEYYRYFFTGLGEDKYYNYTVANALQSIMVRENILGFLFSPLDLSTVLNSEPTCENGLPSRLCAFSLDERTREDYREMLCKFDNQDLITTALQGPYIAEQGKGLTLCLKTAQNLTSVEFAPYANRTQFEELINSEALGTFVAEYYKQMHANYTKEVMASHDYILTDDLHQEVYDLFSGKENIFYGMLEIIEHFKNFDNRDYWKMEEVSLLLTNRLAFLKQYTRIFADYLVNNSVQDGIFDELMSLSNLGTSIPEVAAAKYLAYNISDRREVLDSISSKSDTIFLSLKDEVKAGYFISKPSYPEVDIPDDDIYNMVKILNQYASFVGTDSILETFFSDPIYSPALKIFMGCSNGLSSGCFHNKMQFEHICINNLAWEVLREIQRLPGGNKFNSLRCSFSSPYSIYDFDFFDSGNFPFIRKLSFEGIKNSVSVLLDALSSEDVRNLLKDLLLITHDEALPDQLADIYGITSWINSVRFHYFYVNEERVVNDIVLVKGTCEETIENSLSTAELHQVIPHINFYDYADNDSYLQIMPYLAANGASFWLSPKLLEIYNGAGILDYEGLLPVLKNLEKESLRSILQRVLTSDFVDAETGQSAAQIFASGLSDDAKKKIAMAHYSINDFYEPSPPKNQRQTFRSSPYFESVLINGRRELSTEVCIDTVDTLDDNAILWMSYISFSDRSSVAPSQLSDFSLLIENGFADYGKVEIGILPLINSIDETDFCQEIKYRRKLTSIPNVFLSLHYEFTSSSSIDVDSITSTVQYVDELGFLVCLYRNISPFPKFTPRVKTVLNWLALTTTGNSSNNKFPDFPDDKGAIIVTIVDLEYDMRRRLADDWIFYQTMNNFFEKIKDASYNVRLTGIREYPEKLVLHIGVSSGSYYDPQNLDHHHHFMDLLLNAWTSCEDPSFYPAVVFKENSPQGYYQVTPEIPFRLPDCPGEEPNQLSREKPLGFRFLAPQTYKDKFNATEADPMIIQFFNRLKVSQYNDSKMPRITMMVFGPCSGSDYTNFRCDTPAFSGAVDSVIGQVFHYHPFSKNCTRRGNDDFYDFECTRKEFKAPGLPIGSMHMRISPALKTVSIPEDTSKGGVSLVFKLLFAILGIFFATATPIFLGLFKREKMLNADIPVFEPNSNFQEALSSRNAYRRHRLHAN